ncbi:MAG: NAD-dependent epimerase/dehydratase family protein [bacterium]|nr:NAD-dependent epimerase/dehydratase family protein [bacterium]
MKVLITGISGFVGCHLTRRLAAAGMRVSGLSTDDVTGIDGVPELVVEHVDILDVDALNAAVERSAPDVVVHLAALSHVGASWNRPGDYLRVNFVGTRNLVRAAEGRKVLFASSAEVYGKVADEEQPIREQQPLNPLSPYAMTKACAERVALDHGALVVRSFNAVGPGQARNFAMPSFANQLAAIKRGERGEREPVIKVGDLSPRRDFLHVADAAAGWQLLIEKGEAGQVYNLAGGEPFSILEALNRLILVSGVQAKLEQDPKRTRPADLPLLCGDAGRLHELGWKPEHDLSEALRDLWKATLEAGAPRPGA